MKKVLSFLLVFALAVVGVPAYESFAPAVMSSGAALAADDLPEVTIVFATAYPGVGGIGQSALRLKELLAEKSGGKLILDVHTDSTMGSERENVEMLQLGEIQMSAIGGMIVSMIVPQYGFFDAPFAFRDRQHFDRVWDGKLGDEFRNILLENGMRYIGKIGRGYRQFTSNTPINTLEDMKKLTIRSPEVNAYIDCLKELGSVPVPVALSELFSSLQMGVVNSQEGTMDAIYSYKLYEVQKYITLTRHFYTYINWIMNDDAYNDLPEEYKKILAEAIEEASNFGTDFNETKANEWLEEMKGKGVIVSEFDTKLLVDKVTPALDNLYKTVWTVTTAAEVAGY